MRTVDLKSKYGTGSLWTYFSWFLGSVFIPITIPLLVCRVLSSYRWRKDIANLQGKVVLITGASSGLGEALAHAFYVGGCKLILAARREEELERVKMDLMLSYKTVVAHPPVIMRLDLADMNSIPKFAEAAIAVHGQIDILINNAGIGHRGDALSTSMDVHVKLMMVNYLAHVALTKAILPQMLEKSSGHIIAISSVQGRFAIPYRSAYSAAKHALQAFFDSLRAEVEDRGIRVTVVSPGYIRTSLSLNALRADGSAYGVMDKTTAAGIAPKKMAEQILHAVASGKGGELIVSGFSARCAILLRTLVPSLYFWIMRNRARRIGKEFLSYG